jgi:molybdopterin converting factor small subunit
VPELYVTGAISLVNATFARFLAEEMPGAEVIPTALAGWNKVLSMHLHMMLSGYQSARALDSGDFGVEVSLFGRMRAVTGRQALTIHLPAGARMETALRKFFNYFPQARPEVFELNWIGGERVDASGTPWFVANKVYEIKPMWRVLLNGKDLSYIGGPAIDVAEGDKIGIVPPGR